jgi:hypothetical protein
MDSSKRRPLKKAPKNNSSLRDTDQGHTSLSSLDFEPSLSDKLHSSLGSLGSSSTEDLGFLWPSLRPPFAGRTRNTGIVCQDPNFSNGPTRIATIKPTKIKNPNEDEVPFGILSRMRWMLRTFSRLLINRWNGGLHRKAWNFECKCAPRGSLFERSSRSTSLEEAGFPLGAKF